MSGDQNPGGNFQMQWMLFQEKFSAIDRAFDEVKSRNQEISNSLRDVLNVLESVERVHIAGDKLSSEVRGRIFKEIDRWVDDRKTLEDLLKDIKDHISGLGELVQEEIDGSASVHEKVVQEVSTITQKLATFEASLSKLTTETETVRKAVEQVKTAGQEVAPCANCVEMLTILRNMDGRDDKSGEKFKPGSGDWFRWHVKKGIGGLTTTVIIAIFFAIIVPLFIYFAPKIAASNVFGGK